MNIEAVRPPESSEEPAGPPSRKKRVGIARAKADRLIAELVERARAINEDPQYLYCITRLEVFGSYLTDKEKLGDIDIAYELEPKLEDRKKFVELLAEQAEERSPRNCSYLEYISWPETKTLRALRGRHYVFSLHYWEELQFMKKNGAATGKLIFEAQK